MDAMQTYSTRNAARILQSTEARVRHWARLGGVVPQTSPSGRLKFTFQQLLLLKTTRGLLDAGIPARRVRRIWSSLRRQLSDDMPLTSIRILANGDRAVAWDGKTSWQPDSGQFLLDFDAGEFAEQAGVEEAKEAEMVQFERASAGGGARDAQADAAVITAWDSAKASKRGAATLEVEDAAEARSLTAEQWFHLGCELETESPVEARQAYLQTVALDPDFGDAHLNLGRLLHEEGELGKAEAHYQNAVRCSPDDATCHFNLAVLYEDRGRPDDAILAYERAMACDPNAADCHYNLGLLLDAKGRRSDAMKHLMIARQLYGESRPEQ